LHDAGVTVGVATDGVPDGVHVGALSDGALELKGVGALSLHDLEVLREGGGEGGRV